MAKWNEQGFALKVEHLASGRETANKNADSIRGGEFAQVIISHVKNECENNETVLKFIEECKEHLGESLTVIGEEVANSLLCKCKHLKSIYPAKQEDGDVQTDICAKKS